MTASRVLLLGAGALALLALPGCGGMKKTFGMAKDAPDEFAVTKQAPLAVPPDFNLRPPRPGAPRPQELDSQGQAMDALFGPGVSAPKTPGEQALLDDARSTGVTADIRSTVAGEATVADKGAFLKELLAAQPGDRDAGTATIQKAG